MPLFRSQGKASLADFSWQRQHQRWMSSSKGTTSGSSPSSSSSSAGEVGGGLANLGKAKLLFKQYGTVAIMTYLGVYMGTLASIYAAFEYGYTPIDLGPDSSSGTYLEKVSSSSRSSSSCN